LKCTERPLSERFRSGPRTCRALCGKCDIARSQMDVRFRRKNGHAADITGTTEFDPEPAIGRIEIPQRSSLLAYWGVLSFRSEAREVLIAVHTVQVSAADQAISLLRDLHQRQGADAAIDAAKVTPRKRPEAGCFALTNIEPGLPKRGLNGIMRSTIVVIVVVSTRCPFIDNPWAR